MFNWQQLSGNCYIKNIVEALLGKQNQAVIISKSLQPTNILYTHNHNYRIVCHWQFLKDRTRKVCVSFKYVSFWPFG